MAPRDRGIAVARHLVIIALVLQMAACDGAIQPDSGGSSLPIASVGPTDVILGLYSGRPDPEWALTNEQAATLDTLLATLRDGTGTPPVGGLGYHGFTIVHAGRRMVAYRGILAAPGDGPRAVKEDPNRSVERFLLETSRTHVTPDEFAEVQRALEGR